MGFDAFGLPAEQYAVQTGQHPRDHHRGQHRQLCAASCAGWAWATTRAAASPPPTPSYYRWTQWIFLQIFNSWYDADAATGPGPIAELIAEFDAGARGRPTGRPAVGRADRRRAAPRSSTTTGWPTCREAPVNWCPGLGTVLANEEVTADGRSDRGNFPVFKRNAAAVDDADHRVRRPAARRPGPARLARADQADAAQLDRPLARARTSTSPSAAGAHRGVHHPARHAVRRDLHGAGARAPAGRRAGAGGVAGGHAGRVDRRARRPRRRRSRPTGGRRRAKTDVERQAERREKTGVFTGAYAINPVNGEPIPVFIADYVLMGYGTGAIMAVPGQDERDWEFAEALRPADRAHRAAARRAGRRARRSPATGRRSTRANDEIWPGRAGRRRGQGARSSTGWRRKGHGAATVTYQLRDWLFSRQRYWGEPFPIVYDETGLPIALPESMLPVELPEVDDFSPQHLRPRRRDVRPGAAAGRARRDWVEVELDLGDGPKRYRRETNTMPQWAGSCWYELRYLDPTNDERVRRPGGRALLDGARSADRRRRAASTCTSAASSTPCCTCCTPASGTRCCSTWATCRSGEPFHRLFNQGYIQAYAYTRRPRHATCRPTRSRSATARCFHDGQPVTREYGQDGQVLKNVVTPDEMCDDVRRRHACGCTRCRWARWTRPGRGRPAPSSASYRFLQRLWRNVVDEETGELRVVDDARRRRRPAGCCTAPSTASAPTWTALRFNTAIAKLIELNNHADPGSAGGARARSPSRWC